jgi:hypothetical protein
VSVASNEMVESLCRGVVVVVVVVLLMGGGCFVVDRRAIL